MQGTMSADATTAAADKSGFEEFEEDVSSGRDGQQSKEKSAIEVNPSLQYVSRSNTEMQHDLVQQVVNTQRQLGISFGRSLLLMTQSNLAGANPTKQKLKPILDQIYIEETPKMTGQANGKECLLCMEDLCDSDEGEEIVGKKNIVAEEKQELTKVDCENEGDSILAKVAVKEQNHLEEIILEEKQEEGSIVKENNTNNDQIEPHNEDDKKLDEQQHLNEGQNEIAVLHKKRKYGLGCKHFFCRECFEAYIKAVFSEGSSCIYKTCPLDGCLERLGRDDFEQFLTPEQLRIYDKFLFEAMLACSETAIQCPSAECRFVQVSVSDGCSLKSKQEGIVCQCQYEYCNLCREIWHFPCDCQDFKKWQAKLEAEGAGSVNDQWIIMNTKPCPKCNVNIEKNQGCLHMTCKPCGHHFCWMCLGDWSSHRDYYNCSKFDAAKIKELDDKKKELSRFRFYSGFYASHQANVKIVKNEIAEILKGITYANGKLVEHNMKPIDAKPIEVFCQEIVKARKYLPYLYAKGYFVVDQEKIDFFNNLLEDYVRIVEIYNSNLNPLKDIIEMSEPRLVIKTSFYTALHSLPKKISSLHKYIARQLYQFTKGLEQLESVKKRVFTTLPENSCVFYEKKKQKLAAKKVEKQQKFNMQQHSVICIESDDGKESQVDNGVVTEDKEKQQVEQEIIMSMPSKKLKVEEEDIIQGKIKEEGQADQQQQLQQQQENVQIAVDAEHKDAADTATKIDTSSSQDNKKVVQKDESSQQQQQYGMQTMTSEEIEIYRAQTICQDCRRHPAENEYGVCNQCLEESSEL